MNHLEKLSNENEMSQRNLIEEFNLKLDASNNKMEH